MIEINLERKSGKVSVPYGDQVNFNRLVLDIIGAIALFPSPMGIRLISILMKMTNESIIKFPSPMGIRLISILSLQPL